MGVNNADCFAVYIGDYDVLRQHILTEFDAVSLYNCGQIRGFPRFDQSGSEKCSNALKRIRPHSTPALGTLLDIDILLDELGAEQVAMEDSSFFQS